jgi:hypothetical protein
MRCSAIGSRNIVAFAQALREKVQPQTVGNYLSHLASVFAIARLAWGYDLDQQAMADAIKVPKRLGSTSKSRERSRRPTIDELDLLMGHFAAVRIRRPGSSPMGAIIGFAIFSTRRLKEITRIQWADLGTVASRILVRDMKNPGEKMGNDVWCDLPPEALRVIDASAARRRNLSLPRGTPFPRHSRALASCCRFQTCIFTTCDTKASRGCSNSAKQFHRSPREQTSIVAIVEALYAFTPNWR